MASRKNQGRECDSSMNNDFCLYFTILRSDQFYEESSISLLLYYYSISFRICIRMLATAILSFFSPFSSALPERLNNSPEVIGERVSSLNETKAKVL